MDLHCNTQFYSPYRVQNLGPDDLVLPRGKYTLHLVSYGFSLSTPIWILRKINELYLVEQSDKEYNSGVRSLDNSNCKGLTDFCTL